MDKDLVKSLNNTEIKRAPEFDNTICPDTPVKAYKVESKKSICKIWNSSNDQGFDLGKACKEVINKILSDTNITEGTFNMNFNEIWFEITEK